MKNKELSLNKTIIFNVLSGLLIQGISFFTSPIFSRVLGTNNYGVFSAYLAWQNILVIIMPLSVGSTIGIAQQEFPKKDQDRYQSCILTLGLLNSLIMSAFIVIFQHVFTRIFSMNSIMLYALLLNTLFSFIVNFANTRYTFKLKANVNFVFSLISVLMTIGISLIFVMKMPIESNYWGRILGNLITSIILGIIMAALIYRDGGFCIQIEYIKFCLPLAIPVIFHALSNTILNMSDRIMLQRLSTNSMVGIYSLAYSFGAILTYVYSAFNNSWIPFYYKYLREDDIDKLKKHSNNYAMLYTEISIGFVLIFKEIFHIFANKLYWEGTNLIPIIAVGLFFMYLYSFSINYEFYSKKTKPMAVITSITAALNIILNYFLIIDHGIYGAAIATLISYVFEFLLHYLYVQKMSKGLFPFRCGFYLKHIALFGCGIFAYYILKFLPVIRWIFAGCVACHILYSIHSRKEIF